LTTLGSNLVASSRGGKSFFREENCGAVRATEFVTMLLMNEEFVIEEPL
jgi:hypothetical protein